MSSLYNNFYSSAFDVLPLQTIPLKEKLAPTYNSGEKSWREQCMDALETIGRRQYSDNIRLIENYEMIKGRFIYDHYFHTQGYENVISQLTAEFEMPNYLRHYDLIGQVINELSGEWAKRPDLFKVVQLGDGATNEYLRKKLELTQKFVASNITAEINKKLIEAGLDPNKQDFNTPEEQQQYQQQIQQAQQQLTPPEIQKFMDTDFLTLAEIWGNHQYNYDKEYFNFAEKEKVEFEDMLIADRCFRHFYLGPTGHQQETWNPVSTFFHKSPDVRYIEEGDYVGRIFNLSLNTIIDRYGHLMKKEDYDLLLEGDKKSNTKWEDSQFNWVYDEYLVPFNGYPTYDLMKPHWNKWKDGKIPMIDSSFYENFSSDSYLNSREGFYFVTEAYWKSQKTIIKLTYQDPETGQVVVDLVDENFEIPKTFVESEYAFSDEQDINTYVKTQINEVWKGIKINSKLDRKINKDLYLAVGPNDFQFKGDINIYGCKLPVCGEVFSPRNSKSASLVDMMKPHQIGYNVAMNQLYQIAEKEIGMFVVMDVNLFPNAKDWGGEDAWSKWMMMAKNLGMLPADTSPANISASLAATGGFLPKVLDLNLAGQMVSRMNMAKFFEEQALKQVGFNQYRLGNYSQSSTATGVQQGVQASYSQTESYFTNFSNYLRRCHKMNLDIAQYVQSKKTEISLTYIKSDLNRAFIKVLGSDLLLSELGVLVSNSQEHARQLDMMRQFALQNNTSGMSPVDVADVIMMNSPGEIRRQLSASYNALLQQQQQSQQAQQAQQEQAIQLETEHLKQDALDKQLDRENKLNIARIEAGVDIINSQSSTTVAPDTTAKDEDLRRTAEQNVNLKRDKLELDKQKLNLDNNNKQEKLANDRAKIAADLQIQHEQTQTARIMKGKKLP
jgi:hypothetical protein